MKVLLDTDILSAIMRRNPIVLPKAHDYLEKYQMFSFSIITRYEILRGLKAKNATRQIVHFDLFCTKSLILPITDEIIVKAADIYADLTRRGRLISDADILIAATAIINQMYVTTNNEKHFREIVDLDLENWIK